MAIKSPIASSKGTKVDADVLRFWRTVTRCSVCPTIAPWRKFPAASRGTLRYRCMLVGEAPGRVSLEHGRAFSNPRNLTVRRAFARAVAPRQLELEDVFYITDAVKCWPASATGANRSPRRSEVETCVRRHLRREVEMVKPRLVLAFGAVAARALIGREADLAALHGRAAVVDGVRIVALTHPSSVNITGMRRVGLKSLTDYEHQLASLLRKELSPVLRKEHRRIGVACLQ